MAALLPHQVADLVNLTLDKFQYGKFTDIANTYPQYIVARVMAKKAEVAGGPQFNFKIQHSNASTARVSGLFASDVIGRDDVTTEGNVGWVKLTVNWSYDIDEPAFQSGATEIVRNTIVQDHAARNAKIELMETHLWGAPTGTTDNFPYGIPFWIQKDASTTPEGGWNGGNPTGFTSGAAGVSSTTYPKWRNWTAGYTDVTADDLVRKAKRAMYETNWQSVHMHPDISWGKRDCQMFTIYDVRAALERLAETRNDNLGVDVARYVDAVVLAGSPVVAVPYLQNTDTSDPLYGVNFQYLRPVVQKGKYMNRMEVPRADSHSVRVVHYDTWMNYVCVNRRTQFVISK